MSLISAKSVKTSVLATASFGLVFLLITTNCRKEKAATGLTTNQHVILVFDGLGATKVDRLAWSDHTFYQQYIDYLEHTGGVLELYDFSDSIPNPISLQIKSLYTLPSVYEGESRIQPVKALNDSIRLLNQRNVSTFLKILRTKVWFYDIEYEHKTSYAEGNLTAILESLRLPPYQVYQSSLLLYSDLINCPEGETGIAVNENLISQIIQTNVKIALCSYSQNRATDLIKSTQILSPNDFMEFLLTPSE